MRSDAHLSAIIPAMRKRSDLRAVPPPTIPSPPRGELNECFLHGPYESEECPTCGVAISQPPKDATTGLPAWATAEKDPGPGAKAVPAKGAFCSVCGEQQLKFSGQMTCPNGHGGADTFSAAEAAELRKDIAAHAEAAHVEASKKDDVVKVSAELKEEIAAQVEKDQKVANPLAWGSQDRPQPIPVDPAFEAIVSTVFVDDPEATYKRLEKALVVGDKRTDYGSMMRHLDEAEMNAREAHKLLQTGVRSLKGWEADNQVVWAGMRTQATRSLQKEKDDKLRSKQITDEDVESRMAAIYPDEYKEQRAGHAKMKAMVHSLENLAELWSSRCRTLQVLLGKQR